MNEPKVEVVKRTPRALPHLLQQNILLKALQYTTDLDELKKVAKFHTRAEVSKTLDKLSIRKEYHDALQRHGLDMDAIVRGLKTICDTSFKDDVRLKALQAIMKSLGLDKYDVVETGNRNWEDVLLTLATNPTAELPNGKYEVNQPKIPDEVRRKKEEEVRLGRELYEHKPITSGEVSGTAERS